MPNNILVWISIAGAVLAVVAPKLWEKIKPFLPNVSFPGKDTPVVPKEDTPVSLHDIVDHLIEDRKAAGDEDGVMLIATFGKHLYDNKIGGKK